MLLLFNFSMNPTYIIMLFGNTVCTSNMITPTHPDPQTIVHSEDKLAFTLPSQFL